MSKCVPRPQAAMCYQKMGLVNKHRMIMCISRNRVNQSRMANKSTNQSINHKITCVGPPPKPDLFLQKSISQIPLFWKRNWNF